MCNYFTYIKSYLQYFKDKPSIPHLVVFYEDIKKDPVAEVRRLSEFLGKDYGDDFLSDVANACSFENMKKAEGTIRQSAPNNGLIEGFNFYRKR